MNRFIVIVLDSFGVGTMDDVPEVRPQDIGANTCVHLLEQSEKYDIEWNNLFDMGLMNAVGYDFNGFVKSKRATYGSSNLKHFGADSFFGHNEIAGTDPKKPIFHTLTKFLKEIEQSLQVHGYEVSHITKDNLTLLCVNNVICIGDNMETDLGQAINVVGALDSCGMEMIKDVGHIVREIVKVPRVIAFGGSNVTIEDIKNAIITKDNMYIGVDAPKSGVYNDNYHVEHIGFGIDVSKQVPRALNKKGIPCYFYGKVANIIENPGGRNFDAVDTDAIFNELVNDLVTDVPGFYFVNIQETDLAGHAEDSKRYIDRLNVSDKWIGQIREKLNKNDVLLIMADHGNDPTIGHPKHTRERVPMLIDYVGKEGVQSLGLRDTMADVGQSVAHYFNTTIEFGLSFIEEISLKEE